MPGKITAFVRGVSRLIRNPYLLDTYEQSSQYWKRQAEENRQKADNHASVIKGYQSMLKNYESAVTLSSEIGSRVYFDRESGLLQSFKFLSSWEGGPPTFYMSHGKLTEENLRHKLQSGLLELMTPKQAADKSQWPSSIEGLKQMAAKCNIEVYENPCYGIPVLKIQGVELPMCDWRAVEEAVTTIDQNRACGILTFGRGEFKIYTDPEKYVKEYKDELNTRGPIGVTEVTLSRDPALHKELDDIKWGEAGEENPNDLKYYQDKYAEKQEPEMETIQELEGEVPDR